MNNKREEVMRIGYACLNIGLPNSKISTLRKQGANSEKLRQVIQNNLKSLEAMIDYNQRHKIYLYRISSDLIPFASDKEVNSLDWANEFHQEFQQIGKKIKQGGIRISMHPGQYTVLNSPDVAVVDRAIDDLIYHEQVLTALGADQSSKLVLHIGGGYGDKKAAMDRFVKNYRTLPEAVKNRLIIENDHNIYTIEEVLNISERTGAPVVYDNLHNAVNPSDSEKTDCYWIRKARETWQKEDGLQKVHYSQQSPQGRPGSHTQTIYLAPFLSYYRQVEDLELDVMLEVKDKNLSAVKAILATQASPNIANLEKEWSRYKYLILAKSPTNYQKIRQLLKDKTAYPVKEFYQLIEESLKNDPSLYVELNAVDHIWGHVKNKVSDKERRAYEKAKARVENGQQSLSSLKNRLLKLAKTYEDPYLVQSLYFYID